MSKMTDTQDGDIVLFSENAASHFITSSLMKKWILFTALGTFCSWLEAL